MTTMVMPMVTGHSGIGWNDRTGHYGKCDQGKQRIAKHLHGTNLFTHRPPNPPGGPDITQPINSRRDCQRKVATRAAFVTYAKYRV